MRISKSKFMAGVQCLKRLYLLVHEPKLAAQSDGPDEAIIEQGREVGLLARQLFPGGVEVDGSGGLGEAIRETRELPTYTFPCFPLFLRHGRRGWEEPRRFAGWRDQQAIRFWFDDNPCFGAGDSYLTAEIQLLLAPELMQR